MLNTDYLKDFQAATVEHVLRRFFDPIESADRFLVADEVGLGKTLVARGVVERFRERFLAEKRPHLNVIYICSNQSIASQNIDRLLGNGGEGAAKSRVGRINDLALGGNEVGTEDAEDRPAFLRMTALSPNTSFKVSNGGGVAKERAILLHILSGHPHFRAHRDKLARILKLDVGEERWKELSDPEGWVGRGLRAEIAELFRQALSSDRPLERELREVCEGRLNPSEGRHRRQMIGRLRRLLASVCVRFLHPDLIILDEFQRFKTLIDQDEESDIRMITDSLFAHRGIKTLLLSATPYKMYSLRGDEEAEESHYREFHFVARFLLSREEEYLEFSEEWNAYSSALLRLRDSEWQTIRNLKRQVENRLRKVIARTERVMVSADRNTMLRPAGPPTLEIEPGDIEAFVGADSVARSLAQEFDNIHSPVEYCKSSAYPFSFLEGYHLSRRLQDAIREGRDQIRLRLRDVRGSVFLPFRKMDRYEPIEYSNPKLRHLLGQTVRDGGADLLWIPPSLPYYKFEGPFRGKEAFTKTLVFSSWMMVPKMIAAMLSYECERLTIGSPESREASLEKSERTYFQTGSARHPRARLKLKVEDGQLSSLASYALLYPSLYLTHLWNPFENWPTQDDFASLVPRLAGRLRRDLDSLRAASWVGDARRKADDRWPLILMILLDRSLRAQEMSRIASYRESLRHVLQEAEDEAAGAVLYFDKVFGALAFALSEDEADREIRDLNLGPIPENIAETLALLAIASPSISAGRTLGGYLGGDRSTSLGVFKGALRFGNQFRKFLNVPENIACIDKYARGESFWKNALQYLAAGNFQSMLDEFAAGHFDRASLWDQSPEVQVEKLGDALSADIGLRTVSVTAQSFGSIANGASPKHLRCHFAVSLNHSMVSDKEVERSDRVRDAFNSPFRPFVLATTSIGQEGLDFHHYCRRVLHWNLPANPVDLEQREGRINRFKNLAIRQNIAAKYGDLIRPGDSSRVWPRLFESAAKVEKSGKTDLVPYWHVEPEKVCIERQAPAIPYSKEALRYPRLLKSLSLYRVALGQPRQEELVEHLLGHFEPDQLVRIQSELLINLSPITHACKSEPGTAHSLAKTPETHP